MKKELAHLVWLAEQAGWRAERGKRGSRHVKLYCPCGEKHLVVIGLNGTDFRGVLNARLSLERTCYGKMKGRG